jgi:GNAT superfamily N-acetyltransferase
MPQPADRSHHWPDHVGERIVVRTRTHRGLVDVLGDLLAADEARLLVRTRRGEVEVDVTTITAGHPVPPPPARAAPPHLAPSVSDLERVMADHWRAPDTDWLGGWLLRSAAGFTNRANSVLAVGEPGMPMDVAVQEVLDWYAARGRPAVAASPEPGLDDGDTEGLLAAAGAFAGAGWQVIDGASADVMTAATGRLRDLVDLAPAGGRRVRLDAEPDTAWLDAYHYRGQALAPAGLALLRSAPEQVFASVRDGDRVLAVARGSLARRWAGLTAVEVVPAYRRQGLARLLAGAVAQWGWDRGAASLFVQVATTNAPARALYDGAGFTVHHRYDYLTPPA